MKSELNRVKELLIPLIHKEERRSDSFLEEDMEDVLSCVEAFQFENEMIRYLEAHPNAAAQEIYHFLPEGLPPGDDGADLLDEED